MTGRTFFLALQWQHTVHRYFRVLHRRMMKSPPKKVTMEEARKAHHIRWPLLSHGTSGEKGMITFILDMWMDGSGLNFSRFFDIVGFTCRPPRPHTVSGDSGAPGSSGQRPLMRQRLSHVRSTSSGSPLPSHRTPSLGRKKKLGSTSRQILIIEGKIKKRNLF